MYRIIYENGKVVECVEHNATTITIAKVDANNPRRAIVDEIQDAIPNLTGKGIDISFLWKNGIINRIEPQGDEIDIPDHPTVQGVKRKLFIHSMPVLQNQKAFWLNLIIRHFDVDGNHIPDQHDDEWFSTFVDNSQQVEGVGEFDYFKGLVDAGTSIFYLQTAQIPQMVANGRFGESLYA